MSLDVTRVQSDDDAAVTAWCTVNNAIRDHDIPLWRDWTPRMLQVWLGVTDATHGYEVFLASHEGQPVGRMSFELPMMENRNTAVVEVWILPAWRRRGLGRQLHDFAVRRAKELGRKRLISTTLWELPDTPAPNLDGVGFARHLGYSAAQVDVVRRLEMSTVDDAALAGMLDHARAKSGGYSTVQWADMPPGEYVADLAYLEARLSTDAPQGDLNLEAAQPDTARFRDRHTTLAARERLQYHTAAVHESTGRIVAWTTLSRDKALLHHAYQQITIVEPEHRGHRLGALVKVENLSYFRAAEPAVQNIDTFNAAQNSYMISINEQMGFRPLYAFQRWQRDIEGQS